MKPSGLVGLLFLFLALPVFSQVSEPDTSQTQFFLRRELAFRFIAHSSGFGFGMTTSYSPTIFTRRILEGEIVNMKAPKEIKTVYPFADNSKSYVFGKLNYLFFIRGGFGYEKRLNRKPSYGGVEVRYLYHAGGSLGFAKPIYLYIINYNSSSDDYSLTTEKYDPSKHFYDNIYGRAPFNYGFNEMKIHPGLYGKLGFQFEYGSENERIKALETGMIVDFFPQALEVMAFNDPEHYFLTFYLSLHLGKRYNRNLDLLGKKETH